MSPCLLTSALWPCSARLAGGSQGGRRQKAVQLWLHDVGLVGCPQRACGVHSACLNLVAKQRPGQPGQRPAPQLQPRPPPGTLLPCPFLSQASGQKLPEAAALGVFCCSLAASAWLLRSCHPRGSGRALGPELAADAQAGAVGPGQGGSPGELPQVGACQRCLGGHHLPGRPLPDAIHALLHMPQKEPCNLMVLSCLR